MASRKRRQATIKHPEETVVVVCRGGDCGSRSKHPGVDHVALLRDAQERLRGVARVLPSKCLDACDYSNVVVIVPEGADSEPVWVGEVNESEVNEAICDFVQRGGPERAAEPIEVELRRFHPTRRNRQELEREQARGVR